MPEDRPHIHTCPTELERQDAFLYASLLAIAAIATWWLILQEWGWWSLTFLPAVALITLSSEAAADVPYLGAISAGLRSKLGLRTAHEWFSAWWHFYRVARFPVWRANCVAFLRSRQRQTTNWLARMNEQTRWKVSRAYLWGSRTLRRS